MELPPPIDLNISISYSNDNEDVENMIPTPTNFTSDLNQAQNHVDDQPRDYFNFDLNQAPSPVNNQLDINVDIQDEFIGDSRHVVDVQQDSENYSETEVVVDSTHEDFSESEFEGEHQESSSKRKFLSNEDRKAISHLLLHKSRGGKLRRGTYKLVASMYPVSIRVLKRIWKKTKEMGEASHNKTKNCGRKRIQIDPDQFRQIPLSKRSTLRDLEGALNISKSSLSRAQKRGTIRRHSNALKPTVKDENKIARIKFCLSMLESGTIPHDPTFKTMHNIVYIDEKWFYMTKKTRNYYLLPEEDEPQRTCQSKNFIGKAMFLVAISRPRFDIEGEVIFDGKIGVFPFVTKEPARRNSVNRAAGTLVTKPITSVNREVSRRYLIEKVIPAIKEKWPRDAIHEPIFIQQDNARCHINENDSEFRRVSTEGGFDIRLMCQPPNSPDLNILDLGFFASIQALQHKEPTKTVDDLIGAVTRSFETYSSIQSNKIFLTMQTCMVEIMKTKGSIIYDIPHIKKDIMQREGRLPAQMKCDPLLVEEVVHYLRTISGEDNS